MSEIPKSPVVTEEGRVPHVRRCVTQDVTEWVIVDYVIQCVITERSANEVSPRGSTATHSTLTAQALEPKRTHCWDFDFKPDGSVRPHRSSDVKTTDVTTTTLVSADD